MLTITSARQFCRHKFSSQALFKISLNKRFNSIFNDGINNKRDPGKRLDINMYEEQHKLKKVRKLPENLLDAIRMFESSKVARTAFGDELVDSYAKLKHAEWQQFTKQISPWERARTLDC